MDMLAKSIATTFHAVFCPLSHEDEIFAVSDGKGNCKWYVESQCADTWEMESHKLWLVRAMIFIKTLAEEGKSDKQIEDIVVDSLGVCRKMLDLRMMSVGADQQIVKMLIEYYGS